MEYAQAAIKSVAIGKPAGCAAGLALPIILAGLFVFSVGQLGHQLRQRCGVSRGSRLLARVIIGMEQHAHQVSQNVYRIGMQEAQHELAASALRALASTLEPPLQRSSEGVSQRDYPLACSTGNWRRWRDQVGTARLCRTPATPVIDAPD